MQMLFNFYRVTIINLFFYSYIDPDLERLLTLPGYKGKSSIFFFFQLLYSFIFYTVSLTYLNVFWCAMWGLHPIYFFSNCDPVISTLLIKKIIFDLRWQHPYTKSPCLWVYFWSFSSVPPICLYCYHISFWTVKALW